MEIVCIFRKHELPVDRLLRLEEWLGAKVVGQDLLDAVSVLERLVGREVSAHQALDVDVLEEPADVVLHVGGFGAVQCLEHLGFGPALAQSHVVEVTGVAVGLVSLVVFQRPLVVLLEDLETVRVDLEVDQSVQNPG